MCLGKAFLEGKDSKLNQVMENVADLRFEDGKLVLTSLFGDKYSVAGELQQIDFNNSKIIIKEIN